MDNIFDLLKKRIDFLIQFVIWLFSIIGIFIIPPPVDDLISESNIWFRFSQLIVALSTGLLILPILHYRTKKYALTWWFISAGLSIISIFLLYTYNSTITNYTMQIKLDENTEVRIVIGNDYTTEAKRIISSEGKISNRELIDYFLDEEIKDRIEKIWYPRDIKNNRFKILLLYILNALMISIFLISVTQSITCYNSKGELEK